jgi:dUTP pyrophosphatase
LIRVKRLDERAKLPTVGHPGEDLGYDLYALEDVILLPNIVTKVRTGIAAEAYRPVDASSDEEHIGLKRFNFRYYEPVGLLIRDRSSMASKGVIVTAGVVDAGYRGELVVMLTNLNQYVWTPQRELPFIGNGYTFVPNAIGTAAPESFVFGCKPEQPYQAYSFTNPTVQIKAGDKIAQMIPTPVLTGQVVEVIGELSESGRGANGFGSTGR